MTEKQKAQFQSDLKAFQEAASKKDKAAEKQRVSYGLNSSFLDIRDRGGKTIKNTGVEVEERSRHLNSRDLAKGRGCLVALDPS